jgi:membrane protein
LFTAFPVFGKFQDTLQRWLVDSLVPDSISRQVMGYLTQFSRKANRLGSVGLVAVVGAAVALMVTIERTLGQIWRVKRQRPLAQRILLYWSALTLGPLFLGGSLAITSFVVSASRSVVGDVLPGGTRLWLDALEFLLLVACISGLYFYVPYTRVRWRHAITAGVMCALGIELAKKILAIYLTQIPTYSAIYGAFAAVPILLVWIYVAWVIVLLGAVVASSLPELGLQHLRQPSGAGWNFRLALEVLTQLNQAKGTTLRGLDAVSLAQLLRVQERHLEVALQCLIKLDWVGKLRDENRPLQPRLVLMTDPEQTPLSPLAEQLLLAPVAEVEGVWQRSQLLTLRLSDALAPAGASTQP